MVLEDEGLQYNAIDFPFFKTLIDRIKPLPARASEDLLLTLDEVAELVDDVRKEISSSSKRIEGLRRSAGTHCHTKVHAANARTKALVFGFMAAEKAEICMTKVLTKKFDFTKSDPIFKVAMVSLAALGTEVRTIGGESMRAVQCMGFTTLLGCVFAAC